MGKYIIGLDAGTTKVKAVLFDFSGHQIADASDNNRVITRNGSWNEQDMDALWETMVSCIRRLMAHSGVRKEEIAAIGLSAQGEGLWPLDRDGNTICSAILWNDGRAADLVSQLKQDTDLINDIKLQIGSFIKPGSTIVQIKWLAENEPELFEKAAVIFTCKDFLRYKMTGKIKWELTDASCSCLDMVTQEYPRELFRRLGIEKALDKLPERISATECAGHLTKEAADALGLAEGTPVSGGMLDTVATAVGAGATEVNSVCTILGTTGMNLMTMDHYEPDLLFNGWECHMEQGKYVKGMGMMSAMPNQNWVLTELFGAKELNAELFAELEPALAAMQPGEGGLLYLPHIDPSGERAPFLDPTASAQIMGIKTTTTKYQILHAVMEGVCFGLRSCLDEIPNEHPILLSGGGAKSNIWPQLLADCTGRSIRICEATELTAKGAALSAAMMLGEIPDHYPIEDFYQIKREITPDPVRASQYDLLYEMYRNAQKAARTFWQQRAAFLKGRS